MTDGRIFDVQRFSTNDGPGIRTTLFLKGCPLECRWCQNPEGIEKSIRLWHFTNLCDSTGACVTACPENALTLEPGNRVRIDHDACTSCGACVDACPRNALALDGRRASVEEILAELRHDRVFHEVSGGGVTFSGGEPLYQAHYVLEVAAELKALGIHTAVETTLLVPWDSVEALLEVIDLFIVDVKVVDEAEHVRATHVRNAPIIANLRRLAERLRGQDRLLVRTPLIPGYTATPDNLRAVGALIASIDPAIPVELMNFNPLAAAKYRRMDIPHEFADRTTGFSAEELARFVGYVAEAGVVVRTDALREPAGAAKEDDER
ncbi:MAG: glycyl-radical enzyme activating protein [Tetrasphaera sp.]